MSEAAFHERRRKGIGGSDAPVLMGQSKRSMLELFYEKTGRIEPPPATNDDARDRARFGKLAEQMIAKEYKHRTGRRVRRTSAQWIHPKRRWLRAHPDLLVYSDEHKDSGIGEIKSPSDFVASEWKDGPPLKAQIQLQHNMMAARKSWGVVIAWIGKGTLGYWDYVLNERFCQALLRREALFWQYVVDDREPPLSLAYADEDAINRAHKLGGYDGREIELGDDAWQLHERLEQAKTELWNAESRVVEIQNELKLLVGENDAGVLPDGSRYQWSSGVQLRSKKLADIPAKVRKECAKEVPWRRFQWVKARPHQRRRVS